MNEIIQTILVFIALGLAVSFMIKKFSWKKPKTKKAFSDAHDCDKCH
ncbi:hypothetical protein LX77_02022 [Gelidibacter algens]|jgi:hypothetical protein|uniref:Attachment p12 family protein n=1 Tax=Gelidibacter algens TaxID=49280 RepID=A0A327S645_9FLAO|nr:hypothetical protein LX77_02022 [Gelidibacter algens]